MRARPAGYAGLDGQPAVVLDRRARTDSSAPLQSYHLERSLSRLSRLGGSSSSSLLKTSIYRLYVAAVARGKILQSGRAHALRSQTGKPPPAATATATVDAAADDRSAPCAASSRASPSSALKLTGACVRSVHVERCECERECECDGWTFGLLAAVGCEGFVETGPIPRMEDGWMVVAVVNTN
jgi:hypothetical protein